MAFFMAGTPIQAEETLPPIDGLELDRATGIYIGIVCVYDSERLGPHFRRCSDPTCLHCQGAADTPAPCLHFRPVSDSAAWPVISFLCFVGLFGGAGEASMQLQLVALP